jgi:hypothetical protein
VKPEELWASFSTTRSKAEAPVTTTTQTAPAKTTVHPSLFWQAR